MRNALRLIMLVLAAACSGGVSIDVKSHKSDSTSAMVTDSSKSDTVTMWVADKLPIPSIEENTLFVICDVARRKIIYIIRSPGGTSLPIGVSAVDDNGDVCQNPWQQTRRK